MPKQVIEPEIISQSQIEPRQEKEQNNRANFHFYQAKSSGCLGLILFAFVSVFVAIPLLVFSLFKKKK